MYMNRCTSNLWGLAFKQILFLILATRVNCTKKQEKTKEITLLCIYNSASETNQEILDQFELLPECVSEITNTYLFDSLIIDILECSPVADRYLNLLETHCCSQGIEEPTRVTKYSDSLTGHLNLND